MFEQNERENDFDDDIDEMDVKRSKVKKLKRALVKCDGYVSEAADMCNISRQTAYTWIKKNKQLKRLISELRDSRRSGI